MTAKPASCSEASQVLRTLVLQAIAHEARVTKEPSFGTEENPAKYGNVEFWTAANGDFCYSIPTHQWDCAAVCNDLGYWF